ISGHEPEPNKAVLLKNTPLAPLLNSPHLQRTTQKLLREALTCLHIPGAQWTAASCHQHNASISTIWQISYPPSLFPALLMGRVLLKKSIDQGVELELEKKPLKVCSCCVSCFE
uniref:Uncharacterized protein n=1 Tax=Oryctolagus cuniculus TaxID=9986 RepID=A0A5F9CGE3_RABIT